MAVEHYENFPVASWLCPPRLRPAVTAIYHFARTADDLADEGDEAPAARLAALAAYRVELDAVVAEAAPGPRWPQVFGPLGAALRQYALPPPPLAHLLDAFEQDVHNPPYPDRHALLDYCSRSANPIGRLLLHLYRVDDALSLAQSDAICSALQLTNFWQDLSVDLPRGRLYVPHEDMQRNNITVEQLWRLQDSAACRTMVRRLCDWTRGLMLEGAPLARRLPGRAGWELRLVVQGGLRILDRIAAMDHASLTSRPTLRRRDAPVLLWRALQNPRANG
ncbi:MAG: squalene synthase HpnC [Rubrivivax sp.]